MPEGIWKDVQFWIAVFVAILIKVRTTDDKLSWPQAITNGLVAVGTAYIASEWVADLAGIPVAIAAALVALTSEGIMRTLLSIANDPTELIRLMRQWRGK